MVHIILFISNDRKSAFTTYTSLKKKTVFLHTTICIVYDKKKLLYQMYGLQNKLLLHILGHFST